MTNNTLFLQMLLISGVTAVLFLLLCLFFRRIPVRPAARHLIWWILTLRLLLPFGVSLPGSAGVIPQPTLELSIPASTAAPAVTPDAAQPPLIGAAQTIASTISLWEVLRVIWLVGAAGFLLYQTVGYLHNRRQLLRGSHLPENPDLQETYAAVSQELGLRRPLTLRIAPTVPTPLLLGFFRTAVLLPRENYDPAELRLILRHELTHYRRGDLFFKLLLLLTNAVHWFNPVLPRLRRQAAMDMELACDAAALQDADDVARHAYTRAILSSLEPMSARISGLTTGFQGGASLMKTRISAIFTPIPAHRGRTLTAFVLALALLASLFAGCVGDTFPEAQDGIYNFGSFADTFRVRNQNVTVRYFPKDMTLDEFLDAFGLTPEEANPRHGQDAPIHSYRARNCIRFDETGDLPWSVSVTALEDGRLRNFSYSVSFWGVPWEEAMAQTEVILAQVADACGKGITSEEWANSTNYSGMVIHPYGDPLESLSEPEHNYNCEYLFKKTNDVIHLSVTRHNINNDTTELYGEPYSEVFELTIDTVINRE